MYVWMLMYIVSSHLVVSLCDGRQEGCYRSSSAGLFFGLPPSTSQKVEGRRTTSVAPQQI